MLVTLHTQERTETQEGRFHCYEEAIWDLEAKCRIYEEKALELVTLKKQMQVTVHLSISASRADKVIHTQANIEAIRDETSHRVGPNPPDRPPLEHGDHQDLECKLQLIELRMGRAGAERTPQQEQVTAPLCMLTAK